MKRITLLLNFLLILFLLQESPLFPADKLQHSIVPVNKRFEVLIGKAKVLRFKQAPVRVAISNPGIVYLVQLSSKDWEVIGRNVGITNLYIWDDERNVMGMEIEVGITPPPFITSTASMELVKGGSSELIYLGHPSEKLNNSIPSQTSGLISDMPEPCLVPGCI